MSLITRARAQLQERRGAPGYLSWGDSTPPPPGAGWGSVAGSVVNENTALQVAAVYGSVSLLSDSVSSLPVDLMSSPHRRSGRLLKPSQLLTQPFEEISAQDWWVMFTVSLALRGNFYGHIIDRDRNLYPTQIMPVHPDQVSVKRAPGGELEYRFHGQRIPLDDVFHVRYMSMSEQLVGLDPINYLRNLLGVARAGDMYAGAFFQNSAMPSGILKTPEELDTDEARALKQEWMQLNGGIGAAQAPAVLTGEIEWQQISLTPDQAQFLQSREYSAGVISGQIFRVPPHMIGIVDRTTSWGTGIEQQELGFVRNTLMGYLSRGERALTAVHPPGQFVKFDLSERLRGDRLQRFQAYNLARMGGWMNADEIRAEEDQPPLPDGEGQEYLVPINSELLTAAIEQAKQMQEQPVQPVQQQPQRPQGASQGPVGVKRPPQ